MWILLVTQPKIVLKTSPEQKVKLMLSYHFLKILNIIRHHIRGIVVYFQINGDSRCHLIQDDAYIFECIRTYTFFEMKKIEAERELNLNAKNGLSQRKQITLVDGAM